MPKLITTSCNNRAANKRSRKTRTARIHWTEEMEREILAFAKESISLGQPFEVTKIVSKIDFFMQPPTNIDEFKKSHVYKQKPSAPDYYKKFVEKSSNFDGISANKVVEHMRNLKRSYTTALNWRNQTGQGILETDPENGAATVDGKSDHIKLN